GGDDDAEHDRGGKQLVEDLAVEVDVMPHEVRVERRHHRSEHAGAPRQDARADRVDEECRCRRDDDLRKADRPPLPVEDPVDGHEEEAVERLRVRGGLAWYEAERPVMYERQREVVALVCERAEDLVSLVQQHDHTGDDRREGDQPQVSAPQAATKSGASTCSRSHSSSMSRHQRRCPWSARPLSCSSRSRTTVFASNQPRSVARTSRASACRSWRNQRPSGTPKPVFPRAATSGGRSWAKARRSATLPSRPRVFRWSGSASPRATTSWSRNGDRSSSECAIEARSALSRRSPGR